MVSTRKEELIAILDHFNIQVIAKSAFQIDTTSHFFITIFSFVTKEFRWAHMNKLTTGGTCTTIVSKIA